MPEIRRFRSEIIFLLYQTSKDSQGFASLSASGDLTGEIRHLKKGAGRETSS